MGITDKICQGLQQKYQDILNVTCLVSSIKSSIQKLRDFGWDVILDKVTFFCNSHDIQILDISVSLFDLI